MRLSDISHQVVGEEGRQKGGLFDGGDDVVVALGNEGPTRRPQPQDRRVSHRLVTPPAPSRALDALTQLTAHHAG